MSNILVIGDIILDEYLFGRYHRINPENSKGQVFKVDHKRYFLGGAAAVANICVGLENSVKLIGTVGNDHYGDMVIDLLHRYGINSDFVQQERNTTVKSRLVSGQSIMQDRVDFDVVNSMSHFPTVPQKYDIVLLSDYGKGVCDRECIEYIHSLNCPVLVDPDINKDWLTYGRPDLIKCNRNEIIKQTKHQDFQSYNLHKYFNCNIIVTDGANGMYFWSADGLDRGHIEQDKLEVLDICGAGDTVFAIIGSCFVKNRNLKSICTIANNLVKKQLTNIGINRIYYE